MSIAGRATPEATFAFIHRNTLSMHHRLEKSGLFINPVIHGPPRPHAGHDNAYVEALMKKAVVKNASNCITVYHQNVADDKVWHATGLAQLLSVNNGPHRAEIVTIANIGRAKNRMDILKHLSDACKLTELEYIDLAIFEVTHHGSICYHKLQELSLVNEIFSTVCQINEDVMNNHGHLVAESIETLELLCAEGKLQSFGTRISVAPYLYHAPAPSK
jgi:hypothetical protein